MFELHLPGGDSVPGSNLEDFIIRALATHKSNKYHTAQSQLNLEWVEAGIYGYDFCHLFLQHYYNKYTVCTIAIVYCWNWVDTR